MNHSDPSARPVQAESGVIVTSDHRRQPHQTRPNGDGSDGVTDRHELCDADETTLAQLYANFADEDRELAEAGLAEYSRLLAAADRED
jgi:hypothetical protein